MPDIGDLITILVLGKKKINKKKANLEEIENSNTKGSKFWNGLPDWFIKKMQTS